MASVGEHRQVVSAEHLLTELDLAFNRTSAVPGPDGTTQMQREGLTTFMVERHRQTIESIMVSLHSSLCDLARDLAPRIEGPQDLPELCKKRVWPVIESVLKSHQYMTPELRCAINQERQRYRERLEAYLRNALSGNQKLRSTEASSEDAVVHLWRGNAEEREFYLREKLLQDCIEEIIVLRSAIHNLDAQRPEEERIIGSKNEVKDGTRYVLNLYVEGLNNCIQEAVSSVSKNPEANFRQRFLSKLEKLMDRIQKVCSEGANGQDAIYAPDQGVGELLVRTSQRVVSRVEALTYTSVLTCDGASCALNADEMFWGDLSLAAGVAEEQRAAGLAEDLSIFSPHCIEAMRQQYPRKLAMKRRNAPDADVWKAVADHCNARYYGGFNLLTGELCKQLAESGTEDAPLEQFNQPENFQRVTVEPAIVLPEGLPPEDVSAPEQAPDILPALADRIAFVCETEFVRLITKDIDKRRTLLQKIPGSEQHVRLVRADECDAQWVRAIGVAVSNLVQTFECPTDALSAEQVLRVQVVCAQIIRELKIGAIYPRLLDEFLLLLATRLQSKEGCRATFSDVSAAPIVTELIAGRDMDVTEFGLLAEEKENLMDYCRGVADTVPDTVEETSAILDILRSSGKLKEWAEELNREFHANYPFRKPEDISAAAAIMLVMIARERESQLEFLVRASHDEEGFVDVFKGHDSDAQASERPLSPDDEALLASIDETLEWNTTGFSEGRSSDRTLRGMVAEICKRLKEYSDHLRSTRNGVRLYTRDQIEHYLYVTSLLRDSRLLKIGTDAAATSGKRVRFGSEKDSVKFFQRIFDRAPNMFLEPGVMISQVENVLRALRATEEAISSAMKHLSEEDRTVMEKTTLESALGQKESERGSIEAELEQDAAAAESRSARLQNMQAEADVLFRDIDRARDLVARLLEQRSTLERKVAEASGRFTEPAVLRDTQMRNAALQEMNQANDELNACVLMIASAEISESLTQFDDWKQRIAEAAGLEAAVPQEEGIDASMDALEIIPLKQRLDEFCSFFEETRSISQRLHENRQRRDALTNGISELSVALERIERDLHQLEAERVKLRSAESRKQIIVTGLDRILEQLNTEEQ